MACEARSGIREEGLVGVGAALHPVSLEQGGAPCPDPRCPRLGVLTGARLTPRPPSPRRAAAPAGLAAAAPAGLPAVSAAGRLLLQVGVSGPLTRPDLLGRK